MTRILDLHTHHRENPEAIVNLTPCEPVPSEGWYSVGIHPWEAHRFSPEWEAWLREAATAPNVAAIGEAGIDRFRGEATIKEQERVFLLQAELAESLGKPLIIHCVRAWEETLRLHRLLHPVKSRWIIHGFRGKPALARQLTDAGLSLSIGEKFNPGVIAAVPSSQLFIETDESPLPIAEIASRASLPVRDIAPVLLNGHV